MEINPDFVAPCGLYCGGYAIYMAHRDNNDKFKERSVTLYRGNISDKGKLPNSENLILEDIRCRGCLSDDRIVEVEGERQSIGPREFCFFPRGLYRAITDVHPPVEALVLRAPSINDKKVLEA